MLLYLFMHIVETSMVLLGPDVYNTTLGLFHNLPIRLGEVLLMAALVYHSLNGLKVILIDFVPADDGVVPPAHLRRDHRHRGGHDPAGRAS